MTKREILADPTIVSQSRESRLLFRIFVDFAEEHRPAYVNAKLRTR